MMKARIEKIHQQIKNQQNQDHAVLLIAVSKFHDVEKIAEAYEAGVRDFAENYVQEAVAKIKKLPEDSVWHFIGHIQSNKTRLIAEYFHWVHTVSSIKVARLLNRHAEVLNKTLFICLEINVDEEPQKSGISLPQSQEIHDLVSFILDQCPNLKLRGLMCILADSKDEERQLESFKKLARLKSRLEIDFSIELDMLSMGMSGDFKPAVKAGSTMVRIGTAIFGARG
ncbi:MAG: YggS family pyridoxal phosphate-dependent enzyme [Francisellaceae bacterium]